MKKIFYFFKSIFSPVFFLKFDEKKKVTNLLKSVLSINENQIWADLGCGPRPFFSLFSKHRYIGIDYDNKGLKQAPKLADVFYDGTNIPFENNYFDGVLSTQVLTSVENDEKIVKEIFRVLKKDGYLVVSVSFAFNEVEQPFDFRRYTIFGISKLLEDAGFEIDKSIKSLSGLETIGVLLSVYLLKNIGSKYKFIRRLVVILICYPIQLLFLLLSYFIRDNKDLYANTIILARK